MFVYFITRCLGYDTNLAARVLESCIQCLSYSAIVCIGDFLILQRLANRGFICLDPLHVSDLYRDVGREIRIRPTQNSFPKPSV